MAGMLRHSARGHGGLWLGASALALMIGTAAHAQATENQNPTNPGVPEHAASPEAQSANGASNPGDAAEIVVTAQFRQQRLQDTPLAITAVNSALMEAKSQTNLAQVADNAPNVTLKPQGGSFGPSVSASIRGIGQGDFNPAYEPGVGIYIDDVYYPQLTGAVFDLLDLDRIEILRGPQGTLSGRNSEGGSIKMFSKKPEGTDEGFVEATYGSRNRIGVRAGADIKLTDTLFGRLSGVYKHENGYVDQLDYGCVYPAGGSATYTANDGTTQLRNPTGGIARVNPTGSCRVAKLGEIGYEAVRAMLRFTPTSAIDLMVSGEYTHDEHNGGGEVLVATSVVNSPNSNIGGVDYDNKFICGKYCNFSTYGGPAAVFRGLLTPPAGQPIQATDFGNRSLYDAYNLAFNAHITLNDAFSIDNILAYQNFKTTFGVDDDLSPLGISDGYNHLTHWNWSEELRLNVKLLPTASLVVGGYYFKQETDYFSFQDLRYVPVYPLQFIQPDRTPAKAAAGFANVNWEILPGLTFNGGTRYTDESKEYHYFRLNPDGTVNGYLDPIGASAGPGAPGALTGAVARYKGNRWDWRAAIDYRFSPAVMVYGSFSTGFKGGGTNPRPFYASQVIAFDPEVLYNYEIGAKTDLFDRKLRLNVTGFYGILRNAQIGVSICPGVNATPCAALLNAGNAHEKGFEVETTLRPTQGLTIDGSVSYLDFHYTSLSPSVTTTLLSDPRVGSPKWKWTIGAQYEVEAGDLGSITPRIDASYQDKLFTGYTTGAGAARSLVYIPQYTVLNARLTWQNPKKDLSASLEVTNLTNKYYFLTAFDLQAAGGGVSKRQPGRPREWAVTLRKKF